jgi:hypothetical protein
VENTADKFKRQAILVHPIHRIKAIPPSVIIACPLEKYNFIKAGSQPSPDHESQTCEIRWRKPKK